MVSDLLFDYLKNNSETGLEICDEKLNIKKESYQIKSDKEVQLYSKPKGKYLLLSIPDVLMMSEKDVKICTEIVANNFKNMIGDISNKDRILVVGLGNRHISSDSLGAKVVHGVNVTFDNKYIPKVMAIAPSVMGLTGIETVDIVDGVVSMVKPTHLILIDSLCASGIERLGSSIQITDNGVCPGAGIGNKRKCIDKKIVKNIFTIGVPLLIYASTFVSDTFAKHGITIEKIDDLLKEGNIKKEGEFNIMKTLKTIIKDQVDNIIVSIKDIEECVCVLSRIIADAINIVLGVSV